MRKVTPHDYATIFENSESGQLVFADLALRFWTNPYKDNDRDTAHACGQMSVIDFINSQIEAATNGNQ